MEVANHYKRKRISELQFIKDNYYIPTCIVADKLGRSTASVHAMKHIMKKEGFKPFEYHQNKINQ